MSDAFVFKPVINLFAVPPLPPCPDADLDALSRKVRSGPHAEDDGNKWLEQRGDDYVNMFVNGVVDEYDERGMSFSDKMAFSKVMKSNAFFAEFFEVLQLGDGLNVHQALYVVPSDHLKLRADQLEARIGALYMCSKKLGGVEGAKVLKSLDDWLSILFSSAVISNLDAAVEARVVHAEQERQAHKPMSRNRALQHGEMYQEREKARYAREIREKKSKGIYFYESIINQSPADVVPQDTQVLAWLWPDLAAVDAWRVRDAAKKAKAWATKLAELKAFLMAGQAEREEGSDKGKKRARS